MGFFNKSMSKERMGLMAVALVMLCFAIFSITSTGLGPQNFGLWDRPDRPHHDSDIQRPGGYGKNGPYQPYEKPAGVPVIGLIFFGRREFVSILTCYLERNLATNGGFLDEVIFVVMTEVEEDIKWLDALLETQPLFRKHTFPHSDHKFDGAWKICEKGKIYIKIDDDVVFIEDGTIPKIVKRKLENPEYLFVSTNGINQPPLAWTHYHFNAFLPYLPEIEDPPADAPPTWRGSELPNWKGPDDFTVDVKAPAKETKHQRWLPAPNRDIDETPVGTINANGYEAYGTAYTSWQVAAQTHYSFLDRLEHGQLHRFKFDLYDMHYQRISINFLAILGDDVHADGPNGPVPAGDDEEYLTLTLSKRTKRHTVVEGGALTVHYAFFRQTKDHKFHGLQWTDVLERYRAYAVENVCRKGVVIPPWN